MNCSVSSHTVMKLSRKMLYRWSNSVISSMLCTPVSLQVSRWIAFVGSGRSDTNPPSGTSGRNVLRHILQTKTTVPVSQLIEQLSLRTADSISVEALCDEAIRKFPEEAELIRGGKKNILMKLVGCVVKASRGGADAKLTRQILERKLATKS